MQDTQLATIPKRFRVYDPKSKRMIEPDECVRLGIAVRADGTLWLSETGQEAPEDWKVLWSTGMQDNRGIELFEGDLCEFGKPVGVADILEKRHGVVFWNDYMGRFILSFNANDRMIGDTRVFTKVGDIFPRQPLQLTDGKKSKNTAR